MQLIYPANGMSEFTYMNGQGEGRKCYRAKSNRGQIEMYAKLFAALSRKSFGLK